MSNYIVVWVETKTAFSNSRARYATGRSVVDSGFDHDVLWVDTRPLSRRAQIARGK